MSPKTLVSCRVYAQLVYVSFAAIACATPVNTGAPPSAPPSASAALSATSVADGAATPHPAALRPSSGAPNLTPTANTAATSAPPAAAQAPEAAAANTPATNLPPAQQGNAATSPNEASVPTQPPATAPISGDPNRLRFAFFTHEPRGVGTQGFMPMTAMVFTEDANFCTRAAAPILVEELAVYELPLGIFNAVLRPDTSAHLRGEYGYDPPGINDLGFMSDCEIYSENTHNTHFSSAGWIVTPIDTPGIETATKASVNLTLANPAQTVNLVATAQRCPAVSDFMPLLGGNHTNRSYVKCIRTEASPKFAKPE